MPRLRKFIAINLPIQYDEKIGAGCRIKVSGFTKKNGSSPVCFKPKAKMKWLLDNFPNFN